MQGLARYGGDGACDRRVGGIFQRVPHEDIFPLAEGDVGFSGGVDGWVSVNSIKLSIRRAADQVDSNDCKADLKGR